MRPIEAIRLLQRRNQQLVDKIGHATQYTRESDEIIAAFAEVVNRAGVLEETITTVQSFVDGIVPAGDPSPLQYIKLAIDLALYQNRTLGEQMIQQTKEILAEDEQQIDWDAAAEEDNKKLQEAAKTNC